MPPKRTSYSETELAAIISRAVADALAARDSQQDSDRTVNTPHTTKPCSYKDFLSCKPLYFKGTEGAIGLIRWIERMESVFNLCNCTEDNKVKFAAYTFQEGVLTWWNTHVSSVGIEASNQTPWGDLKEMLKEEYCPNEELQKLEEEFWNLKVQGTDIAGYTTKFQQLALLCPAMVDPEPKRIKRYIRGLPESIQGNVASSKPTTIQSAIRLSHELVAMMVSRESSITSPNNKRKFTENTSEQHKKPNTIKAYTTNTETNRGYTGNKPFCSKCNRHHDGQCSTPCNNCNRYGHLTKDCRAPKSANNNNARPPRACFECGNTGHFRNECPKLKNKGNNNNNNAKGRAFVLNSGDARQDPNVVTGMFFLNNLTASVLFDTGADRSFISDEFYPLLDITPIALDAKYTVELANGKLIETNSVIPNCTLNLANENFSIDLMPVEIGSFDVIIGMDWLSKHRAEIVCYDKIVRIPLAAGRTLIIQGETGVTRLNIISCLKTQKFLRKGYPAILAHIMEKKSEEKRLEDVPIVRDFPEVFSEDLPGLPPTRQVEFAIDLVPGAEHVARVPYRLAASEMQELATQLQ